MKTERIMFLEWHFNNWCEGNSCGDASTQKEVYERVYSHEHTRRIRNLEYNAWRAATKREGFKFVPVEPTQEMNKSGLNEYCKLVGVGQDDIGYIYKAMIGACDGYSYSNY